ncbi:MAG: phosphotransferase [Planctomycetaceae bacterium]|nr:phosphotransferase [Planctomycetaceae bacterium]
MNDSDLSRCRVVLSRYPEVLGAAFHTDVEAVTVGGGFSGARVWRVVAGENQFSLRRWPEPGLHSSRLRELHRWLRYLSDSAGCPVAVPAESCEGASVVCEGGAVWQLEPWLPGAPDNAEPPPANRLTAAMQALAVLHRTSQTYLASHEGAQWFSVRVGPSPAVLERLGLVRSWTPRLLSEARLRLMPTVPTRLSELAMQVIEHGERTLFSVQGELEAVSDLAVPLFPCLRDVWRDHILFEGDCVTGLIDAAAARTETVGADLSRYLGSTLGNDPERWNHALERYAAVRPLSDSERVLIPILDRSNLLLSGLHWVRQIVESGPLDPDGRIAERLSRIVRRLDSHTSR